MRSSFTVRSALAIVTGLVAASLSAAALADPPTRVARLAYTTGSVSFSPAAEPDQWGQALVNRPLFIGDRLWADRNARAELEFGTALLFAAPQTSLTILNIDERITQLELAEGRVDVRVRLLADGETFEIDTPNLAFVVTQPGHYRVEVDARGDSTVVAVQDGRGEVYGEGRSYLVADGQWFRFYGTSLDNDYARVPPPDEFDRWAFARAARYERAQSGRYVARTVIGYADLDDYGSWHVVPEYGEVWFPKSVAADWAPYRNGHWSWIDPWGWTWIDEAPWGFAPFHYGRWARVQNRWGWVPGPTDVRPVYAPALVAFVGGDNFRVSISSGPTRGIAWFPLAPGEVYRPPYQVSRNYFTAVNVTNTRIDQTTVVNVYSNQANFRDARYRYRDAPAAMTVVPVNAFVESRPVARAALSVRELARIAPGTPLMAAPPVTPERRSVMGAAPTANVKPPVQVRQRQAVARSAPPPAPPAYEPPEHAGGGPDAARSPVARQAVRPREAVRVVAPSKPAADAATAEHRGRRGGAPEGRDREEVASPGPRGPEGAPPVAPASAASRGAAQEAGGQPDRRGGTAARREVGEERPRPAQRPGTARAPEAAPPAAPAANAPSGSEAPGRATGGPRESPQGRANEVGRPADGGTSPPPAGAGRSEAPPGKSPERGNGRGRPEPAPAQQVRPAPAPATPPAAAAPPHDAQPPAAGPERDVRQRGPERARPTPPAAPAAAKPGAPSANPAEGAGPGGHGGAKPETGASPTPPKERSAAGPGARPERAPPRAPAAAATPAAPPAAAPAAEERGGQGGPEKHGKPDEEKPKEKEKGKGRDEGKGPKRE